MKIPISNYINDLLFHHDCVVVSGLGAFILNARSSLINEKGEIDPPKKTISFNALIIQNDGLLANYISEKNNISYEEACLEIARFSKKIIFRIKSNKRVLLENLGELEYIEDKINFIPIQKSNFDKNSFGLKSFYFPKKKKKIYKLYQKELQLAATLILFIGLSFFFFSKYSTPKHVNLSNISPFMPDKNPIGEFTEKDTLFEKAGIYNLQVSQVDYDLYNIVGTNYHIITKKCFKIGFAINSQIKIYDQGKKRKRVICFANSIQDDYSDCYDIKNVYNKIETNSEKIVVMDKKGRMRSAVLVFEETILDYNTLLKSKPINLSEQESDLTSRFIEAVNSLSGNNNSEIEDITFSPIDDEPISITQDKKVVKGDYMIIVGSFSAEKSAQNLVNQLIKKGYYSASLAGKSSSNLYRVSCSRFDSEKIAKKELIKIKQEFKGAWVLDSSLSN